MSNSLQAHGLQHGRLPFPSLSLCLLKLISTESVMPPNCLILCCHFILLPSIFPSIRVFSNESVLLHIRWPKYRSFSFSISPSEEYPGLVSFRMDWLDLLAVQGTLESLLQHPSSKASILWLSAFFIVQLSPPNMTTGKTRALDKGKRRPVWRNLLSRRTWLLWLVPSSYKSIHSCPTLQPHGR